MDFSWCSHGFPGPPHVWKKQRAPERSPPPPPRSPRRSAPNPDAQGGLEKGHRGEKTNGFYIFYMVLSGFISFYIVFIWFYMVFHGLVEVWKLQTLWLFTWYDNRVHFEATEMKSHIHLSYPHHPHHLTLHKNAERCDANNANLPQGHHGTKQVI